MKKAARELEIKFALTGEQYERLKLLARSPGVGAGDQITKQLRSVYYDTPDCRLQAAGFSLRIRQSGNTWHQTVKTDIGVHGGVSHPVEFEAQAKKQAIDLGLIDDLHVRRRLGKLIDGAKPIPMFETRVERVLQPLVSKNGAELELALDKGVIKAGKRSLPICEAELELKNGNPVELLKAAERLFSGESFSPSAENKSTLGYRLLAGKDEEVLVPLKSPRPELKKRDTSGEALVKICDGAVRQVLHNWQVVLSSDDPEGPHQMRVGLRRLRSALKVFRPLLRDEAFANFEKQFGALAGAVGELRDADVLRDDIVKPLDAHHGPELALTTLTRLVDERSRQIRADVRSRLTGGEFASLRIRLALLPAMIADPADKKTRKKLDKSVRAFSAKALERRWRRVVKRAKRIDELTEEERHALRKDLKALRYTSEFFWSLYPDCDVEAFVVQLQKLQELFGYLNDVAMARNLARIPPEGEWVSQNVQSAIGFAIGWHTAHAKDTWTEARSNWNALKKSGRFWD
jgi:inorganic triphosphatase YgiF